MTSPKGPVLFDLDAAPAEDPAKAPPVPDDPGHTLPEGQAMARVAALTENRQTRLGRWFWRLLSALVGTLVTLAAWNTATALIASTPVLGWAVTALFGAFALVLVLIALREAAAFSRLARVDRLRHEAESAQADDDLAAARRVLSGLRRLYAGRPDMRWGLARLAAREPEIFDASGLIGLAETDLMAPLDAAARREIETAARQVATVTALVPLAFADVLAALTANLRMIRRIAEIYGGRSGVLGSWRLTRAVMAHLVATGAVAVGDDMLEPLLGGGLLGKLSRRFGEGLVNGALTARVGVAAMQVCRPLPFGPDKTPSARGIVRTALAGLFTGG